MKKIFFLLLIAFLFTGAKCRKDKPDSNGLPPATQEGKSTVGFFINGKPWKPQGTRVTSNLSIDYDPGFNQGIFNIVAYNFVPAISEQFTIGIRDSLNFIEAPKTFNLNSGSIYVISFSNQYCEYFSTLSDVESSGTLTLTKLDRNNKIISGSFNARLIRTGCDTINISEGRFDMKY
jgi:hypothetical protein